MKQNVKCTMEDIINLLKEKYRKEGEQSLCHDNDWHMSAKSGMISSSVSCCITAPPEFDEETDEEIIPDFAVENGMDGSVLPEILQDVIINALEQKKDATNEELLKALNYYMDRDAFMSF